MRKGALFTSFTFVTAGSLTLMTAACRGDTSRSNGAASAELAASSAPSTGPEKLGETIILATTTSTRDSGLLDVLVPEFEQKTGVKVKVIAVGTGAALAMAEKGDADAVLTHAPASERRYVESGDLTQGQLVMHNDFILVGPATDPARVRGASDLRAAVRAIAEQGAFISRGDDSGTHKKELELWKAAGVDPKSIKNREETGQGMGATLQIASERGAYTLTDRATFLALRRTLKLEVLSQGDATLLNVYHAYVVSPSKHPRVKSAGARAFVDFLVAPETQRRIASFGTADFGEPLFVADAEKSEADLAKPSPDPRPVSSATAPEPPTSAKASPNLGIR
jgi:tungstate transport system substrate-binding protein